MQKLTLVDSPVAALLKSIKGEVATFTAKVTASEQLKKNQLLLNQSEIKFLKDLLTLTDGAIIDTKEEMTNLREILWESCDPSDADSLGAFKELNKIKAAVRKLHKHRATIASINTKLKKQMKVS